MVHLNRNNILSNMMLIHCPNYQWSSQWDILAFKCQASNNIRIVYMYRLFIVTMYYRSFA